MDVLHIFVILYTLVLAMVGGISISDISFPLVRGFMELLWVGIGSMSLLLPLVLALELGLILFD